MKIFGMSAFPCLFSSRKVLPSFILLSSSSAIFIFFSLFIFRASFSSSSSISMLRRSVTASLIPPVDELQHSNNQQTITVMENSRHRQPSDHKISAQLANVKINRWSGIWGGRTANGSEGRKDSDGNSVEELISALKTLNATGKMTVKSAEAQKKGAAALAKWASKSNNEALAEVVGRVSELMEMHAERQQTFAKDYGHYLKQLQKVAETERKMRAQSRQVEKLADEERRLGKMLAKKGDGAELRAQWERVKRSREWAEQETEQERHEAEFAQTTHLAAGLKGLADVQLNLARAGQLIFTCQRELAPFVSQRMPQVEGEGSTRQHFEGMSQTRRKVTELRRSLEAGEMQMAYNAPSSVERRQRQRRSEPCSMASVRLVDRFRPNRTISGHPLGTPPPPYTPSAPPLELLDSATTRSFNSNRHSVGPSLFLNENNATPSAACIYPQLPPNPFAEELKLRMRCRGPKISVE